MHTDNNPLLTLRQIEQLFCEAQVCGFTGVYRDCLTVRSEWHVERPSSAYTEAVRRLVTDVAVAKKDAARPMIVGETAYLDEHKVGAGRRTYRIAVMCNAENAWWLSQEDGERDSRTTEPLAPELRREAYFTWELSADLREAAGSKTAMHPHDWDRQAAAHWPGHPSIDTVLASRGYDEDGSILS
jgi:hypothetical protein